MSAPADDGRWRRPRPRRRRGRGNALGNPRTMPTAAAGLLLALSGLVGSLASGRTTVSAPSVVLEFLGMALLFVASWVDERERRRR